MLAYSLLSFPIHRTNRNLRCFTARSFQARAPKKLPATLIGNANARPPNAASRPIPSIEYLT